VAEAFGYTPEELAHLNRHPSLVAAGLLGLTGYTIACGTERWAVKTGGDVDAGLVDLSNR
jgi:hypothetical protein